MPAPVPSTAFRIYMLGLFGVFGNPVVLPLLPMIMKEFAVTPLEMGLMITLFALPAIVVIPVYGVLVDRLGRKPLLLASLAGCVLSSLLCALAPSYATLLFWRTVQGLCVTPVEAMVNTLMTDNYQGEERRKGIGSVTSFMYLCGAAYPLLSTAVMSLFGWRASLLIPVCLGLVVLCLFLRLPMRYAPSPDLSLQRFAGQVRQLVFSRNLLALFLVRVVLSCVMFGIVYPHLAMFVIDRLGAPPFMAGIMFAVAASGIALGCLTLNAQSRCLSVSGIGLAGGLAVGTGMGGLMLAHSLWTTAAGLLLYGFGIGTLIAMGTVMVSELTTPDTRATVFAANSTVFRATQAAAPPLCGLVFGMGGFVAVFGMGAGLAVLLAAIASLTFARVARTPQQISS